MCLILFAWRQHAEYPLALIANRDEYYARPTRDAHWWDEAKVFGGRDLQAGGTWLGIGKSGRFAAVTNVREPGGMKAGKKSRGALTQNFLLGEIRAEAYLEALTPETEHGETIRLASIANLAVNLADDAFGENRREATANAISRHLDYDEESFLLLMGEIYELRDDVQAFLSRL